MLERTLSPDIRKGSEWQDFGGQTQFMLIVLRWPRFSVTVVLGVCLLLCAEHVRVFKQTSRAWTVTASHGWIQIS